MFRKYSIIPYHKSNVRKSLFHKFKFKLSMAIIAIFVLHNIALITSASAKENEDSSTKASIQSSSSKLMDKLSTEQQNTSKNLSSLFHLRLNEILNNKQRIDTGDGFINEIINDNDRLKYYDLYIKLAKERGYIVTSYIDYLEHYKDTDKKVLILRHDIDAASPGTQKMFDIERKEGVIATYYFRWKTFDLNLIKEIHDAGFEVGLHYETIATYCIDHHTRQIGPKEIAECRKILKDEIKEFKEKTGINIKTISSHGNPINREIHMPNSVLLKGQNYSDYGIVGETYDRTILKNYIKSYICDNDLMKKYGFSYQSNPIDAIMQDKQVIEFLSHPSHWYYTVLQREKMALEEKINLNLQ